MNETSIKLDLSKVSLRDLNLIKNSTRNRNSDKRFFYKKIEANLDDTYHKTNFYDTKKSSNKTVINNNNYHLKKNSLSNLTFSKFSKKYMTSSNTVNSSYIKAPLIEKEETIITDMSTQNNQNNENSEKVNFFGNLLNFDCFLLKSNSTELSYENNKVHKDKNITNLKNYSRNFKVYAEKSNIKNVETYNKNEKVCDKNIRIFTNKQIPEDYLNEIFENLHFEEKKMKIKNTLLEKQKDVSGKMRAIIISWLGEVHTKFQLSQSTLFLAVNYLDRYLAEKQIKRTKLQLLAVTCLFLACKYEEIFSPSIIDFLFIIDNKFFKEDFIYMELDIVKKLNFDLLTPTPLKFFEILALVFNFSQNEIYFGFYLLELFLLSFKCNNYLPSLIATTICFIILKHYEKYNINFFSIINYNEQQIVPCANDLCYVYDNIKDSNYKSVYKKYSSKLYGEVANNNFTFINIQVYD